MTSIFPPLPDNLGKKSSLNDRDGKLVHFTIVDEVKQVLSSYSGMALYLQKIHYEPDGPTELRFGYYIIGNENKRMAGRWVWGQYAPMIPADDFTQIVRKAQDKGWFTI
jgi:hypothetical protein